MLPSHFISSSIKSLSNCVFLIFFKMLNKGMTKENPQCVFPPKDVKIWNNKRKSLLEKLVYKWEETPWWMWVVKFFEYFDVSGDHEYLHSKYMMGNSWNLSNLHQPLQTTAITLFG